MSAPERSVLLLLALVGCGAPPPPAAVKPTTVAIPPVATQVASAPSSSSPPSAAELREDVCGQRPGCRLISARPAGGATDANARVVLLQLPQEGASAGEEGETGGAVSTQGAEDVFEARYGSCVPYEYWLAGAGHEPQLLLEVCNDGYGASGVGEDHVTVPGDGTFQRSVNGGSAWRWDREVFASLSPLRVLREASTGSWTLGENQDAESWDWTAFLGSYTWSAPRCDPASAGPSQTIVEHTVVPIPEVADVEAFSSGGWRAHGLGRCAARVGDVTSGRVSAVVMDKVVYVEVVDDAMTSKDEVEIWYAERAPGYMDHCLEAPRPARGLSVSLSTKKAKPIGRGPAGETPTLVDGVVVEGNRRRLAVKLPGAVGAGGAGALSVVLRDSDDGKTVRTIGTSDVDAKDTASLGRIKPIAPSSATCTIADGALEPKLTPPAPDKALLGW